VYQGVTYVVGGFNAKGTPLWRKKKDGGGSSSEDNKKPNLKNDATSVAEKKKPEVQKKTPATQKKSVDKIASQLDNNFKSVISAIFPFLKRVVVSNDKGNLIKTHKIDDWEKGVVKVGNDFYGKSNLLEFDTNDDEIDAIQLRKYTSNGRGAHNDKPVGDVIVEVLKNNNWTEYNMKKRK
jgi:hypothetical protein